jgi:hypothetical protein
MTGSFDSLMMCQLKTRAYYKLSRETSIKCLIQTFCLSIIDSTRCEFFNTWKKIVYKQFQVFLNDYWKLNSYMSMYLSLIYA